MNQTRVVHIRDRIPDARYIGRPMSRFKLAGSVLANPYRTKEMPRDEAIRRYHGMILMTLHAVDNPHRRRQVAEALIACRNAPLACWCRREGEERTAENRCHADAIVEILELYTDDELRELGGIE